MKIVICTAIASASAALLLSGYMLSPGRVSSSFERAAKGDELAKLDAMIDRETVAENFVPQFERIFEAEISKIDDATAFDLEEEIISQNRRYITNLSKEYASSKGLRAVIRKCDPRPQSDAGYLEAKDVPAAWGVVSWGRVEMKCSMPLGGEIQVLVDRSGLNTWKVSAINLPKAFGI